MLDVGCGTGYPSLEILKRMDEQGRIIAIDPIRNVFDGGDAGGAVALHQPAAVGAVGLTEAAAEKLGAIDRASMAWEAAVAGDPPPIASI